MALHVLTAAAFVVVAFPSQRQQLSKIRCNKMPPLVGNMLAGERAVVIAVKMTPVVGKSSKASNESKGDASIC